jgi:hypothetical protein
MTEWDWISSLSDRSLSGELHLVAQPRKLFRLGWAFLNRVRHLMPTERDRIALDVTSDYADGRAGQLELVEAWTAAEVDGCMGIWAPQECWEECCAPDLDEWPFLGSAVHHAREPVEFAVHASLVAARLAGGGFRVAVNGPGYAEYAAERRAQYPIYREVIGDPGAPPRPAPVRLATCLHVRQLLALIDSREAPERMVLMALADALEESGCVDTALLNHLRADTEHFRGCWAVERAAGREMVRLRREGAVLSPRGRYRGGYR